MKSFNVNNEVLVQLNATGRKHLAAEHMKFVKEHNIDPGNVAWNYRPRYEDSAGWSKWQLWELMTHFGEVIYPGCESPFETEIKFLEIEY